MPPLKFSRIVSFSSEDPTHPATSLLTKVLSHLGSLCNKYFVNRASGPARMRVRQRRG